MKAVAKVAVWAIVLAAIGYGGFRVYRIVQERREVASASDDAGIVTVVAVETVRKRTLTLTVPVTGEIEALAVVDVIPKVSGRLERLRLSDDTLIEEGAEVEKGQVIALIEHEALDAALEQARAALQVATASRERADVNKEHCQREKERWMNLYSEGSATESQRDQAVTSCDRAVAELKLGEAQVKQAKAAVHQAEVVRNEATIHAPIGGVVSRKFVDEGDMVGPGIPLVRIVRIDEVKIVGGVSERHIAELAPGVTEAHVEVDSYPGDSFDGLVHNIGVVVEPLTRTAKVEIRVPNSAHKLKPGMFARISLVAERRENVPVVSDMALLHDSEEVYAFAVEDGIARRRSLVLGISEGVFHEVKEGLELGEQVVVRGQRQLRDGDSVDLVEETER